MATFINLNVPAGNGFGVASDVSGLGPHKCLIANIPQPTEMLILEGSQDGINYFGIQRVNDGPSQFISVVQFLRIQRKFSSPSSPLPTVAIGADDTTGNAFTTLPTPPNDGLGAPVNSSAFGSLKTFGTTGALDNGQILIEASQDGVNFETIVQFRAPWNSLTQQTRTVDCEYQFLRVRRQNTLGFGTPGIQLGYFVPPIALFPGFGGVPASIDIGDAGSAGASGLASRSDHEHPFPASVAPPTDVNIGDAATPGVATTAARSDHEHGVPAPGGAPPNVAAASAVGIDTTPARSDHTHGGTSSIDGGTGVFVTGSIAPVDINIGDVAVTGTAGTAARADHEHAFPASVAVPASVDIGDVGTPGVATTPARSDHEHPVPASGIAPPDVTSVGSTGVATTPARSDHTHGGLQAIAPMLTWGNNSVAASVDTRILAPGYDRTIANLSGSESGGGSEGAYRAVRAGTMRNMRVQHNSNNGNGNSVDYTLRVNGVLTALTVSLATGAIGTASDLINTVAIAAGDLIEMVAVKALALGSGVVVPVVSVEFRQ